ncbi:MAG: Calx-beta domain-containing protein, partial [Lysobacterales bacterium]
GGATDSYTLVLTTIPSSPVTITITPDSQLSTLPTTLTITAGDWNIPKPVVVSAVDDAVTEGPHTGTITHSATGGGYDGVLIPGVTASIADNDTATLSISDVSQVEGTAGSSSFQFTVTLSGSVNSAFTVPVSSSDGSAIAGSDYTAIPGGTSLAFSGAAGQAQIATVTVLGDAIVEANETFAVGLGTPTNPLVSITDGSGDGTIVNDDAATVAIDSVVEAEGDSGSSSYAFAITLTGNVQDGFTLPYQSTDGTATAGSDYTSVTGTLSFTGTSGQVRNVLVAVSGDTTPEADETFFVDLGTASVAGVTSAPARGTGTIVNDDLTADVSVSNSNGVSALTPGDSTVYAVVVSNTSSVVDLPAVAIVQTLSPALINVTWTCAGTGGATCPASGSGPVSTTVAMPKGSSLSYQVSATVADTLLDTVDATVTATVQSPYSDSNPANNSVTDSDPRIWDSFADGFE